MDDMERCLLVKQEVFVYKIPPRQSARGYRAADWNLSSPDWTGRLRIMEELDQKLDEIEEFEEYGSEYKGLLEETDLIEDENLLFELERHRRNLEQEPLAGTVWEPSFVLCWVIVSIVTMYVGFLIVAGDMDNKFYKEEL